jgi:hypothetical protein
MARPRKKGVRRHLHIDPYLWMEEMSPRELKALAWYDAHPNGQRTRLCWELIVAAVNGELGVASSVALVDEDAAQAQRALDDLLANMVLDDDD